MLVTSLWPPCAEQRLHCVVDILDGVCVHGHTGLVFDCAYAAVHYCTCMSVCPAVLCMASSWQQHINTLIDCVIC